MNLLATNDPDNFISNSLKHHRSVIDEVLENLEDFSTINYLYTIQRYYGDQAMNELLAEIESDLIFKQQLNLAEHNIYGSSRLGVKRDTSQLHFSRFTASSIDTITGNIIKDSILYQSTTQVDSVSFKLI